MRFANAFVWGAGAGLAAILILACGETPVREDFDPARDPRRAILPKGPPSDFLSPRAVGAPPRGNERPQVSNVQVVDLDGDGLADILVCDAGRNRVSWIQQFPPGVYTEHPIDADILAPAHVEPIDLDGDGDLDLVVANLGVLFPDNRRIGSVIVLEHVDGTKFRSHVAATGVARVADVRAGDLDGDGDLDLAVAGFGYDQGETLWLENTGGWKFTPHELQRLSGAVNAIVVDLDGDGRLDIVTVVSQEWEEIWAFINDGKGGFTDRLVWGSTNPDFGSSWITIVDLDKDGDPDILYSNGDAFDYAPANSRPWHGVQWLENRGQLKFELHRIADLSGASSPQAADVDGDGDQDVVVVSAYNNWHDPAVQSLVWLENDGHQKFTMHDLASSPTHLITLAVGDLDGNGTADVVTGGMHISAPYDRMSRVTLWSNRGSGARSESPSGSVQPPASPSAAGRRLSSWRRWRYWTLAAVVTTGALAYAGVTQARRVAYTARLPPIPEIARQPSAVRAHLVEADRDARADPTSPEVVGALGLAYHADMFYDEAQRCYAIAERLSGEWRWTYYRALARGAAGDAEGFADGLRRVVAAAPEFSPASWQLGEAEFKAGHYDRARESWRRALTLPEPARPTSRPEAPARVASAPIAAYAALSLARLALMQGKADEAREILENITAKAPKFGPAFRLLGTAYAALDRPEDARRSVRVAERSPAYDPYVDPMIDALVRASRSSTFLLQQAASADLSTNAAWREYLIRRALEFDPDNSDALYDLASMLRVLRRYDEALVLFERHQRLVPGDFQTLADIGRCLSGLKRYAEAEAVLRRALEGLDDANTRYDLGLVLDRTGRSIAAIAEYQLALDRNPNHRDSLNNLGVTLASQGKLNEAARQFERLVAIEPENADAHANLGVVLIATGARDLAARQFREALEINPAHARARGGLTEIGR